MDLQSCVVLVCSAVGVLLAALLLGWCHWVSAFYCRGCLHYRRHRRRRAEKKVVREQEEAYRSWKRKNETDWISYQFKYQTAQVNAGKIPGDWTPDRITPPCSPPPHIGELPQDYARYEDNVAWMSPPSFLKYWFSRDDKFMQEKEKYDTQHVTMNKENHEYHEWKRKHDEDVQRAIKNHPIASVFMNLTKSTGNSGGGGNSNSSSAMTDQRSHRSSKHF